MKFAGKKYRWIGILSFMIMLFLTLPVSANDLRQASITIFYHGVTPQEESIALSGAEFVLHKVGIYEGDKWIYEGDFAGCDVSLDDMSASGRLEAAKKIQEYVKANQIQGISQKTDANGLLTFGGLADGLYLIVPSAEVSCGGGVFRSDSFLVQIPETDELGNQIYQIRVEPKNEWVSDDKEPEERPDEKPQERPEQKPDDSQSKGESAKTGDNASVDLFVKILSASAIIIIVSLKVRKKQKADR